MWSNNPIPGDKLGENHNVKRCMHIGLHHGTVYNSKDMGAT